MKTIFLAALLSASVFAAEKDIKVIGERSFENRQGTWVETEIPRDYQDEVGFTVTFMDQTWQKLYAEGSPETKLILELGANILFIQDKNGAEQVVAVLPRPEIQETSFNMKQSSLSALDRAALIGQDQSEVVIEINLASDDVTRSTKK